MKHEAARKSAGQGRRGMSGELMYYGLPAEVVAGVRRTSKARSTGRGRRGDPSDIRKPRSARQGRRQDPSADL